MATPELATLYCRFVDGVVNHRRLDHLEQFLAQDVVEHAPDRTRGLEASRQRLARWLAAKPDTHVVIEDLVVEGNHLMARLRATVSRRAELGRARSGAQVSVSVFEAWSVRDGLCVERWLLVDRSQCPSPPPVPHPNRRPSPDPEHGG